MDQLFPELISYIFRFLSVSDRKEASLVCKKWYNASLDPCLQKDVVFKCTLEEQDYGAPKLFGRKLTHISLSNDNASIMSEQHFINLLCKCSSIYHLDISLCNSLFLSGQLLSNEQEKNRLKESLSSVKEVKLSCLRHMTDVTFTRLMSVMENVEHICLASNNILFNNGNHGKTGGGNSSAVFNFSSFLNFVSDRVAKLKHINLSFTAINDPAIEQLCCIPGLSLDELVLNCCIELSDKGIKIIAQNQRNLKILDLSGCKTLGTSKVFYKNLVNNMDKLHTLKMRRCPQIGQCDTQSLAQMRSLHTIDIGETITLYENDLIQGLCNSQLNLSVVQLAYCPDISDNFVLSLCQLNHGLRHLDLTSCTKITDVSLHAISKNLLSLHFLCLSYCHEISDLGLLGYISEQPRDHYYFEHDHTKCTCMRQKESKIFSTPKGLLKQHQTSISNAQTQLESGETLSKISNLLSLKTLDLSSCPKVTDLGVIEAVKFQEMHTLSLEYLPKLTDDGISHLVRSNPSLERVSLRGCGAVTDASVNSLCTHCPRLQSVNVAQNDKITDVSVVTLSQRSKRLRNLDISFCGNVSYNAVINLERAHPRLKFQFRPHIF